MLVAVSQWVLFLSKVIPTDATWMTQGVPVRTHESSVSLSMDSILLRGIAIKCSSEISVCASERSDFQLLSLYRLYAPWR